MRGDTGSTLLAGSAGIKRGLAALAAVALMASMLIGFTTTSQAQEVPEPPDVPAPPCDLGPDSIQVGESGETGGLVVSLSVMCNFDEGHTNEISVDVAGETVVLIRDTYQEAGQVHVTKEIHLPGVDLPEVPDVQICVSVDGQERCVNTGDIGVPDTPEVPDPEVPDPEVPDPELPDPELPDPELPDPGDPVGDLPVPEDPVGDLPDPGGLLPGLPGLPVVGGLL